MINTVRDYSEIMDFESLLPIFGTEIYLKSQSDNFGWFEDTNFILPFYIVDEYIAPLQIFKLFPFKRIVFTCSAISKIEIEGHESKMVLEEKIFLNEIIEICKKMKVDFSLGAAFRMDLYRNYPDGAIELKFGTYRVDLTRSEDEINSKIQARTRQDIRKVVQLGFRVTEGIENLVTCANLILETRLRQGIKLSTNFEALLSKMKNELADNISFYVVKSEDEIVHGVVVVVWKKGHRAYSLYGGSAEDSNRAAGRLLYWEAMKDLKLKGAVQFDFVGARLDVEKNSKFEGIQNFKSRLGGELETGFIWKYAISPFRYALFFKIKSILFLLKGKRLSGDLIDQERKRLGY